jgi:hypothetical protein
MTDKDNKKKVNRTTFHIVAIMQVIDEGLTYRLTTDVA